ncbi:putative bifunctional diguanylate cyclase/phosphodiesterase [Altererythrobacter xiamenensis]|uniref:putative bifunctional diguanylate cyclase/phosphodiesterase n=1 Tax=Altererythrobacter xiamenensis TaxID=1316679 RepID=UPI000A3B2D81|nr:GGDEF domain-containing phosphodiesterase [Altererythrobacter xiamenensis]
MAREIATSLIDKVSESYFIDNHEMNVGASVGIAAVTGDGTSTSALMTNADLALYEAKNRGRGTHAVYREAMRSKLEERSNLRGDLANALENGQMSISYQPIVRPDGQSVACYEALMRWEHPERGLVPPSVFIPIAEESLLIEQLGAWILRKACSDAAQWPEDIKLTVNVSSLQLSQGEFLATVVEALASSGLAADRLVLELTESIVLEMDEQLEALLMSLHELGVSLALDDFGRGYSSLNYIERMYFAMIKIDRDFVQSAAAGSIKSKAIVTAIVSLARSLKIDVVAEGMEYEEQASVLAELGSTLFQGFHFGYPQTASECLRKSVEVTEQRKVA